MTKQQQKVLIIAVLFILLAVVSHALYAGAASLWAQWTAPVPADQPKPSPAAERQPDTTQPQELPATVPSLALPPVAVTPTVKIFVPGEKMPDGPRYHTSDLPNLVGQNFPPLTAFYVGKIRIYQVGLREWQARSREPALFSFVVRTKLVISLSFDTPEQLLGKTLDITVPEDKPLELLSVDRENDEIVAHLRMRQQIEINGHFYPQL